MANRKFDFTKMDDEEQRLGQIPPTLTTLTSTQPAWLVNFISDKYLPKYNKKRLNDQEYLFLGSEMIG